ncbi:hypothetical protein [Agromyces arachidis]|uniref:hypothetical protein n=1 Tax=Agromyces arachidis TaxID=766966 RepID=UPI00405650FD
MRPTAASARRRRLRPALVASALVLALGALAGCATPSPSTPPAPLTDAEREQALQDGIAELDGVASVDIGGVEPRDENPRFTTVTIEPDAAPKAVLAASDGIALLADDLEWEDPITMRADPPVDGATTGAPVSADPWWSIEVHPTTDAAVTRGALAGLLLASEVDGVVGLSFVDGWPYAVLLEPDRVTERFDELRRTPLFERGGTFTLRDDQRWLKFAYAEGLTSPELIDELAAISEEYPHAEVLLEGPGRPAVLVAKVTTAEAEAIAARLADPALVAGTEAGAPAIAWQVTSPDGDGPGRWEGVVGAA